MEAFRTQVDQAASIVVSTLSTAGAALFVVGAAVLIACLNNPKCFGSCPTYYADSAGAHVLEAEGFSYSIAPLFEARDVDRLRLRPAPDGTVRLEVRNEAFETHYINHLELLEVRHTADETALPDEQNRVLIVQHLAAPTAARDRQGKDLRAVLADPDGSVYRTDPEVLGRARVGDLEDAIELTAPPPSPPALTAWRSSYGCGTVSSIRSSSMTSCSATQARARSTGWARGWRKSVPRSSWRSGTNGRWGCKSPCGTAPATVRWRT
jgi:hypothetical protein